MWQMLTGVMAMFVGALALLIAYGWVAALLGGVIAFGMLVFCVGIEVEAGHESRHRA